MGYPKLKTGIWYICLALGCWMGAFLIVILREASPVRSVFVFGLALMGLVFIFSAGASYWDWGWHARNERMFEVRRYEAITPALELAKVVATLTPDQTYLLPQARYGAEIALATDGGRREFFLKTPFMDIPLTWLDTYVFELCTSVELYPVRRFASDSTEQRMAQAFTAWVTQPHLHLAMAANGPDPAKWVSPGARQRCVEMIWGVEEEAVEPQRHGDTEK